MKLHGVHWDGRRWRVILRVDGKGKHVGYFGLLSDALICANYNIASAKLFSHVFEEVLLSPALEHAVGESKNRNALESLDCPLPGWDFDDAVGRYEGGTSWIGLACWPTSLGRWTKNCWHGMNI